MNDAPKPMIQMPISNKTAKRLNATKRAGESDNDALTRVLNAIPPKPYGGKIPALESPIALTKQMEEWGLASGYKGAPYAEPPVSTDEQRLRVFNDHASAASGHTSISGMAAMQPHDRPLFGGDPNLTRNYISGFIDAGVASGAIRGADGVFAMGPVLAAADKVDKVLRELDPTTRLQILEELAAGMLSVSDDVAGADITAAQDFSRGVSIEVTKRWQQDGIAPFHAGAYKQSARFSTARAEIEAMAARPVLQKLDESCFHKAVDAWRSGGLMVMQTFDNLPPDLQGCLTPPDDGPSFGVFVIQHDWAAAFTKATDFDGGEFRLPYFKTVVEMRISGHRVCADIVTSDSGTPESCILNIETSTGWAMAAFYSFDHAAWVVKGAPDHYCDPIMKMVGDQARAVAIALEAEVAETEVVRAPHRLNAKRERAGKLPLYDFHVVTLAHRKRLAPADAAASDGEHRGKRMHFVRGHWRHYERGKTWIKWHLRGNPDLGFIEKEYRL